MRYLVNHGWLARGVLVLCMAAPLGAQSLRVGAAEVVISPPAGTPMAGYYSTRLSTGVHDDLHAKAIVMAGSDGKAALVACDLIGIPLAVVEEARALIEKNAGIPASHVMISATHSHTGPLIPGGGGREGMYGGNLPTAREYRAALPGKIAESVRLANGRLARARALFGKRREENLSFNRRYFMKDGSVGWNPGKLNPNIVKPAGPIDPDVPVVLFESASGEPIATYVNFAMHQDTVGGTEVSADYAYALAGILGKIKGAGVLKTYSRLTPTPANAISAASTTVMLDLPRLAAGDEERAAMLAKQLEEGKTLPFLDTVNTFKVLDTAARRGKPVAAAGQG